MKVCVYAICKNEAQFVRRWMDSMGEADQIVVLDEGKVAGIGDHETLMKTCKTYQEIARSQLSEAELGGAGA